MKNKEAYFDEILQCFINDTRYDFIEKYIMSKCDKNDCLMCPGCTKTLEKWLEKENKE